jgi:hypothetical protein
MAAHLTRQAALDAMGEGSTLEVTLLEGDTAWNPTAAASAHRDVDTPRSLLRYWLPFQGPAVLVYHRHAGTMEADLDPITQDQALERLGLV